MRGHTPHTLYSQTDLKRHPEIICFTTYPARDIRLLLQDADSIVLVKEKHRDIG